MSLEKLESIDILPIKLEDSATESLEESGPNSPVKRKKCGEIYLEEHQHFALVCAICKNIYFDLSAFATHYLKEHADNEEAADNDTVQNYPMKTDIKSEDNIREFKIEESPEFIYIYNPELEERVAEWEIDEKAVNNDKSGIREIKIEKFAEFIDIGKTEPEERITVWEIDEEAVPYFDDDRRERTVSGDMCRKNYTSEDGVRRYTCKIESAKLKPMHPNRPYPLKEEPKRNRSKSIAKKRVCCDKHHTSRQDCENYNNPDKDVTITHPDLYCEICPRQFTKGSIFRRHALYQHTTPPAAIQRLADYLQCMFCHRKFTDIAEWRQHEKEHKNDKKPYVCLLCPKQFSCRNYLRVHLHSHTGEKPYKCDQCSLVFAGPEGLRVHRSNIHLKLKPFACKLCDKKYTNNHVLSAHIKRAHTGEKPFQCETCGKCFVVNRLLREHHKRHTNTRNWLCTFCPKAFFNGGLLRKHMRIHSDIKDFKCKLCGKEFAQPSGLYLHMKSHRKKK